MRNTSIPEEEILSLSQFHCITTHHFLYKNPGGTGAGIPLFYPSQAPEDPVGGNTFLIKTWVEPALATTFLPLPGT